MAGILIFQVGVVIVCGAIVWHMIETDRRLKALERKTRRRFSSVRELVAELSPELLPGFDEAVRNSPPIQKVKYACGCVLIGDELPRYCPEHNKRGVLSEEFRK